jgi:hypothetical protein
LLPKDVAKLDSHKRDLLYWQKRPTILSKRDLLYWQKETYPKTSPNSTRRSNWLFPGMRAYTHTHTHTKMRGQIGCCLGLRTEHKFWKVSALKYLLNKKKYSTENFTRLLQHPTQILESRCSNMFTTQSY